MRAEDDQRDASRRGPVEPVTQVRKRRREQWLPILGQSDGTRPDMFQTLGETPRGRLGPKDVDVEVDDGRDLEAIAAVVRRGRTDWPGGLVHGNVRSDPSASPRVHEPAVAAFAPGCSLDFSSSTFA